MNLLTKIKIYLLIKKLNKLTASHVTAKDNTEKILSLVEELNKYDY